VFADSKIIMIPKTGQLRIANVDENDLRHSYTCRIVNKLTGFTQESSTFGRIYFGKRILPVKVLRSGVFFFLFLLRPEGFVGRVRSSLERFPGHRCSAFGEKTAKRHVKGRKTFNERRNFRNLIRSLIARGGGADNGKR